MVQKEHHLKLNLDRIMTKHVAFSDAYNGNEDDQGEFEGQRYKVVINSDKDVILHLFYEIIHIQA